MAESLRPDLVITDLHMPRLSGIECTMRLRELMPQTRFIVFTDLNAPFTESDCAEPGADFYLYKEHMPERVMTAIRRLFPALAPSKKDPPQDYLGERRRCLGGLLKQADESRGPVSYHSWSVGRALAVCFGGGC